MSKGILIFLIIGIVVLVSDFVFSDLSIQKKELKQKKNNEFEMKQLKICYWVMYLFIGIVLLILCDIFKNY